MKNIPLLSILLVHSCISFEITAQNIFSARNASLSGAGVVLDDVHSVTENPAQNTAITNPTISASIQNLNSIAGLNFMSCSIIYPINKQQAVSIHYARNGTKNFYEQEILLSYGIKISPKLNIGAQMERRNNSYVIENSFAMSAWSITVGASATPLKGFTLGASISNPSHSKWNNEQRTEIPSFIRIGTCISLSTKTFLYTQVNKESSQDASYSAGIEYKPIDQLHLRAGMSSHPFQPSFGAGLAWKNTRIDFSILTQSYLGLSTGITIQQKFR